MIDEASYRCQSCGESIVVPVDPSAGAHQEYVEDCPVCCRPHLLTLRLGPGERVELEARAE